MTRLTLFAIFALCLIPLASAQSTPQATFKAASVAWTDGESVLGSLVALQVQRPASQDILAQPSDRVNLDHFFELTAPHVTVQTVSADVYTENSAFFSAVPPPLRGLDSPTIHRTEDSLSGAHIVGTASRSDRALYAFPLDSCTARVTASSAAATASSHMQAAAVSRFDSRDDIAKDVSSAVEIQASPGSDIVLEGCFVVMVWEWDADWTADHGAGTFHSGKADPVGASDPTGTTTAGATVGKAQQVYFFVQDGTLALRGNQTRQPLVFVDSADVKASSVTLLEADGQVAVGEAPLQVAGQLVRLHGAMQVALTRNGSRLNVQVQGLSDVAVDGRPIAISSTAVSGSEGWPWPAIGLGLFGAVAVPVLAVPVARRLRRRGLDWEDSTALRAEDHLARLEFEPALALADKLLARESMEPEWHLLRGRILASLGRAREALQHHTQAQQLLRGTDANLRLVADNAYAGARAAAHLCAQARGADEDRLHLVVLEWMRQGAQAWPDLVADYALQAELQPFVSQLALAGPGHHPAFWELP